MNTYVKRVVLAALLCFSLGFTRAIEARPLAFSPDGKTLAIARNAGFRVWLVNAKNGKEIGELAQTSRNVAFSPNGKLLACSARKDDKNSEFWIWDVKTRKVLLKQTVESPFLQDLLWAQNGMILVVVGAKTIGFWNTKSWQLHDEIAVPASSIALSPDGKTLAVGRVDTSDYEPPKEYNPDPNARYTVPGKIEFYDMETAKLKKTLDKAGVVARLLSFSPDGKTLASLGNGDGIGQINLWNVEGELLHQLGSRYEATSMAFSPDGSKLIVTSSYEYWTGISTTKNAGMAELWDLKKKKVLEATPIKIRASEVLFSPDGEQIIVSGNGVHFFNNTMSKHLFTFDDG